MALRLPCTFMFLLFIITLLNAYGVAKNAPLFGIPHSPSRRVQPVLQRCVPARDWVFPRGRLHTSQPSVRHQLRVNVTTGQIRRTRAAI